MSLNYEFTPIDVDILSHPKAFAAGVEAMGLWLWGQAHCKLHRSDGRIHRAAALAAWGGKRNIMLAKRLVDAGLWLAREDGDWDVWNHEKKAPKLATTPGAKRTKDWRDRKKNLSLVTSSDGHGDVTRDVSTSTSTSASVSSGSSLGSDARGGDGPPDWWQSVLDTIEGNLGEKVPSAEAWLRYDGHRAGKNITPSRKDALYWLTTVLVRELRDARDETARRNARDGERTQAFVQQRSGPEVKPQDSRKQFREREAWEREAGPPDPETAARMRALLGKVGT